MEGPAQLHKVDYTRAWYHLQMALNIKDAETEQLAAQVAALAGETKTRAVKTALPLCT